MVGFEAKTTRIGADGGVDVPLFQNGQAQPVMIIQCKAEQPGPADDFLQADALKSV